LLGIGVVSKPAASADRGAERVRRPSSRPSVERRKANKNGRPRPAQQTGEANEGNARPDSAAAPSAPEPEPAAASEPESEPELQTFGSPPEQFWLVQHDGDLLSIWCDHMPADKLLEELRAIGGPTFSSKQPLTRPVTLSFHRARIEEVLRKMLDGFNFAYYYENGRLAHVKVLEMIPGRGYKVASPVESRSQWTRRVFARPDE
jgi:hypothetical protein